MRRACGIIGNIGNTKLKAFVVLVDWIAPASDEGRKALLEYCNILECEQGVGGCSWVGVSRGPEDIPVLQYVRNIDWVRTVSGLRIMWLSILQVNSIQFNVVEYAN